MNVVDRSNGKCVKTRHVWIKRGGKALGDRRVVTSGKKKKEDLWGAKEKRQAWSTKQSGRMGWKSEREAWGKRWQRIRKHGLEIYIGSTKLLILKQKKNDPHPLNDSKEKENYRKEGATDSSRGGSVRSQRRILILGAGFLLLSKLPFQITHMNGIYSVSFFNTNHAFCFYQFHPAFVAIFSSFPSQHIHCKGFLDRKSMEH